MFARALALTRPAARNATTRASAFSSAVAADRAILVYGGAGALGVGMVDAFKEAGWHTTSIDYAANDAATQSILLDKTTTWAEATTKVQATLDEHLKFNVIVNAAGGWAGGTFAADSLFEDVDRMHDVNVRTAFSAARIATTHLAPRGLLVLIGTLCESSSLITARCRFFVGSLAQHACAHTFCANSVSPVIGRQTAAERRRQRHTPTYHA
jgi:NAD(P)-dependent dehydrogenase (short-subunit alcohol dehydrogenase family)